MRLYEQVELKEGVPVQFLGAYVLNWPKTIVPEVGFVEAEEDSAEENALLKKALEEIQAEARSSLPVDGMYANKLQFYQAKVRRIETLATRTLDSVEGKNE